MAKRILSADSALLPQTQISLASVRTESRGGLMAALDARWASTMGGQYRNLLFDWEHPEELEQEIRFINQAQATLDEAAIKLAPSLLRVVLTVKAYLEDPAAQRAYLAEHLRLDFRRVSELCIVADSYGLLDADYRQKGEQELKRYGWSNALKLAYVRDSAERRDIWERACAGKDKASYRAVLEELRRFRERKLVFAPASIPPRELQRRLAQARTLCASFADAEHRLDSPQDVRSTMIAVETLQKELSRIHHALKESKEPLKKQGADKVAASA